MEKQEHLYEALMAYEKSDFYPYHMPGHKRYLAGHLPGDIMGMDITEIPGFDDLHAPKGLIAGVQDEAARLYGAEHSFCLINGSTGGILAAISAAIPFGGKLLVARNCHKSVYHAAFLRHLQLSYIYPNILDQDGTTTGIPQALSAAQVEAALSENTDADGVLLVSPTYEGRMADISKIAEVVHAHGIPLLVDEAHGAHLGFCEGFSKNAILQGADLVVNSVHKTLPALTQTALLHVKSTLVDVERVKRYLRIYQSSSPSYLLLSSIDNALDIVAKEGDALFADFLGRYRKMEQTLQAQLRCLQILTGQDQDVGKLVILSRKTGLSGLALYEILLHRYHLQLEMAGPFYCLAMFSIGDAPQGYARLTKALLEIDAQLQEGGAVSLDEETKGQQRVAAKEELCGAEDGSLQTAGVVGEDNPGDREELCKEKGAYTVWVCKAAAADLAGCAKAQHGTACSPGPERAFCIWQAWEMDKEEIALEEAVGRVAADFVNLYPPGTPLLVPGEIWTQALRKEVLLLLQQGFEVQGVEKCQSRCEK